MTKPYRQNADPALIQALAEGKSVVAAAAEAGISRRTAFRRLKEPEIQHQIDSLREDLTDVAIDHLCHTCEPASKELKDLVHNAKSESVKLAAIKTTLSQMHTIRQIHKLRERIRELEAALQTALDQQPQSSDDNRHWPHDPQKTPSVVGLALQQGYRHVANWMEVMLYKGGLTDEKKQEFQQEILRLRDAAKRYDEAIAS